MSARDDLYNDMFMLCVSANVDFELIRNRMTIILNKYEISDRCTEIATIDNIENEDLLKKFLVAKMVRGCTRRTIELYQVELTKTLRKINKNVKEITADDVRVYLAQRLAIDHVTKTTANNERRNLSSFFGWLHREGIIQRNPLERVDKLKEDKKVVEVFTDYEVELLRSVKDERIKCIIEMLLSTGCRVSELVSIKTADIIEDEITILGKGNKYRKVFLNAKAKFALNEYLKSRKDNNPYLFPRCVGVLNKAAKRSRAMKAAWWKYPELIDDSRPCCAGTVEAITRGLGKKLGMGKTNPHKFRKTCATMALKRGMPLLTVSQMLGHENVHTTQIYLSIDEEELKINHKKYVL